MVGNLIRDQFLKAPGLAVRVVLACVLVLALLAVLIVCTSRRWRTAAGTARRRAVRSPAGCRSRSGSTYVFLYIADRRARRDVLQRGRSPRSSGSGFSARVVRRAWPRSARSAGPAQHADLVAGSERPLLATVLGTLLAVGLARYTQVAGARRLGVVPAVLPDLVLGIGLLAVLRSRRHPRAALGAARHTSCSAWRS